MVCWRTWSARWGWPWVMRRCANWEEVRVIGSPGPRGLLAGGCDVGGAAGGCAVAGLAGGWVGGEGEGGLDCF